MMICGIVEGVYHGYGPLPIINIRSIFTGADGYYDFTPTKILKEDLGYKREAI